MGAHMSYEQYVLSSRAKAACIAASVLAGALSVLEDCCQLDQLRSSVEVPDDDPDFQAFNIVQSETDSLPIGSVRKHWSHDALAKLTPELHSASEWAAPIALPACKSVVARFGA